MSKQQPRQTWGVNLTCANCSQLTDDWYMLRDEIWQSIARPGERYLCLNCDLHKAKRTILEKDVIE